MPLDLARLYDEHAPSLYAFVLNLTRSEVDSRDAVQEVFVRLAQEPRRFEGIRDARAFLLRLAHNLAIDALRRRTAHSQAVERAGREPTELFAPAVSPDEQTFRDAVSTAISVLPEEQRAVVHLKIWEEQTFAEIAETLGIPANTAASRYRYALDKLDGLLRPICAP
jgi:RNA polymerase sigma-70 factor (ECF subfamily)